MTDSSGTGSKRGSLGLWSLVCGLGAFIGLVMIGQASFGSGFDPPGWLRIVTGWMLPIGTIAAFILGGVSVKRNSGRALGIAGMAFAAISVVAFVVMLATHPY